MNGGYYTVDLVGNLTLMSMNTMYFNNAASLEYIGDTVVTHQNWINTQLTRDRNFILIDHIYAGARFKHDTSEKA